MEPKQQEDLVRELYADIFSNADLSKFDSYFSKDFVEDNNYDVLDHETMIAHIKDISQRPERAKFDLEFLVNIPGTVVVRTIVTYADQIAGAPPLSLLISYWHINENGLFDRCIEVEYETPSSNGDDDDHTDD